MRVYKLVAISVLLLLNLQGQLAFANTPQIPQKALEQTPEQAPEPVPKVVVSIKPLHSLAVALMEGVAYPELLVSGKNSLHNFQPKPSDMRRLSNASLFFYLDDELELFVDNLFAGMRSSVIFINLGRTSGLSLLPIRTGVNWEKHSHCHSHIHGHGHNHSCKHSDNECENASKDKGESKRESKGGVIDWHVWLNPDNAKLLSREMAKQLIVNDPNRQEIYQNNLTRLIAQIEQIDQEIQIAINSAVDIPFVVFHDAYQYFEQRYALNAVGSIVLDPSQPASAKRLYALRKRISALKPVCIFSELGANPRVIATVLEGHSIHIGELDPEGAQLTAGSALYFELMRNLTTSITNCLLQR